MAPACPSRLPGRARFYAVGALAILALLSLNACGGGFFGGDAEVKLPGKRISVLTLQKTLVPDPSVADHKIRLPAPIRNPDWPMAGGTPQHALQHVEATMGLKLAWSADIGEGSGGDRRLLAVPVTGGGRIYTLDSNSTVAAFSTGGGEKLWAKPLTPEDEDEGVIGGGLAYFGEVLYVTTGYGEVHALDAASGENKWTYKVGPPLRAAPVISGGRLFVISHDNQIHSVNVRDGSRLWAYTGLPEVTGIIGSSSPAVQGGVVIAPYASGELVALRVENGRPIWRDQLVRSRGLTPLSSINAIRGLPVIDGERVYAISHSGRMAAIDLRSGRRAWIRDIAGVQTPWLAGDYIYLVTTEAEVLCLSRADGRIYWVRQLARYTDPEDLEGPIQWSGPVLASDRLLLVSSEGEAITISPYDGALIGSLKLPGGARISPIVADGALYLLTENGDLLAYR